MIAMALACRPKILIADEPTTALDVTTQIEVLAAIKHITRKYDTAAIYITHDLAVVRLLADRLAMALPDELLTAIEFARKIRKHGARRKYAILTRHPERPLRIDRKSVV